MSDTPALPPLAEKVLRFLYVHDKLNDGELSPEEAIQTLEGISREDCNAAFALLVELGLIEKIADDDAPLTPDIRSTLTELTQAGDLRVADIRDGEPLYCLEEQGLKKANEIIAKSFGISVEDFQACPETVQARIIELVIQL
jgi:hypothetical protein